ARERRRHLRRRGEAAALPGHGVRPGADLAADARPDRPAGDAGRPPHRRADRPRTGRGPRAGSDPPRHQAGQHPAAGPPPPAPPPPFPPAAGERGRKVRPTDFGRARAADDASISQSGVIAGTPLYMAPEQARGDTLDPRADLFSLGSVLYTMASGRPPFRAANPLAVLKRVAEDTPRPIREVIPEVPQWLCDFIARLHAKDPA